MLRAAQRGVRRAQVGVGGACGVAPSLLGRQWAGADERAGSRVAVPGLGVVGAGVAGAGCGPVMGGITARAFSLNPFAKKEEEAPAPGEETADQLLSGEFAGTVLDDSGMMASMANLILDVHTGLDVPWWSAIVITTLGVRFGLSIFNINSMATGARMRAVQPYLLMMRKQMEAAQAADNRDAMVETSAQMRAFMKERGVGPLRMLLAPLLNVPVSMVFFWALQSLCRDADKIEGFSDGGGLWFSDLGAPDPYAIVPALSVVFSLASIQLSASLQSPDQSMFGWSQESVRNFMRGLAVVFGAVSASFPVGLTLSFSSTSFVMLMTNLIVRTSPIQLLFNFPKGYPNNIQPELPPGLSPEQAEQLKREAAEAQKKMFQNNPLAQAASKDTSSSASGSNTSSFTSFKGLSTPAPPPPPPSSSAASTSFDADAPPPPPGRKRRRKRK